MSIRLDHHKQGSYSPGASMPVQLLWYFLGAPLLRSSLIPFSQFKVAVLRLFGATIAEGVRIKPGVRVKFPWRLAVGEHSWIGEDSWIDNLAPVHIGKQCCISQGVYFCTGNHDWSSETFDLRTGEIQLGDYVWIAAKSVLGPGVRVGEGAVLTLGSVASEDLQAWTIYRGAPAVACKARKIVTDHNADSQTTSPTTQNACSE